MNGQYNNTVVVSTKFRQSSGRTYTLVGCFEKKTTRTRHHMETFVCIFLLSLCFFAFFFLYILGHPFQSSNLPHEVSTSGINILWIMDYAQHLKICRSFNMTKTWTVFHVSDLMKLRSTSIMKQVSLNVWYSWYRKIWLLNH